MKTILYTLDGCSKMIEVSARQDIIHTPIFKNPISCCFDLEVTPAVVPTIRTRRYKFSEIYKLTQEEIFIYVEIEENE